MDFDSLAYENPFRKNFESHAAAVWVIAACVCLGVKMLTQMPAMPFYWMGGLCLFMALMRLPGALALDKIQRHLGGRKLEFISMKELVKKSQKLDGAKWLGKGFVWENRHVQRIHEIMKRDISSVVDNSLDKAGKVRGQPWIHGIEADEGDIKQDLGHSEGQNLVIGTTGAGKSRLFDLLISQAILRNECVFIIDPKNDKELRDNAERACHAAGHPERFAAFRPAYPEDSIRLDLLKNFSRVTQIASRIAALIPSEGGGDPFKSFAWSAVNNICQGLFISHERPNLVKLKKYLESGPQEMVVKAVRAYADTVIDDGATQVSAIAAQHAQSQQKQAFHVSKFYYQKLQPIKASPELEGLLTMFEHDKTHFGKMIANLIPIMNMLTANEMGALLSPDYEDFSDTRAILDSKKIIDNKMVVYVGLDSLTDDVVGSAIGSLALADLVAVSGDRYNYEENPEKVNVFIDEAAEVVNKPTIQLLNKGRGAGVKLYVATQTIADFEERLGSKSAATQMLGNLNNVYALRCIDDETKEFFTNGIPATRIKYVMRTQGNNTNGDAPALHGANTGERLMEEEVDMIPPQLLGMLPDLEYFSRTAGGNIIKGRIPILTA